MPPSPAFRAAIDGFLAKIPTLPWDFHESQVYGKLRANRKD
jgi:hypothetical protein